MDEGYRNGPKNGAYNLMRTKSHAILFIIISGLSVRMMVNLAHDQLVTSDNLSFLFYTACDELTT